MPRGPVGGATAALISALAQLGVTVSPYQIERWRMSGELPRVTRRGLGRGKGTASEEPDEQTIQMACILARSSRQGSPRVGGHVLDRFAAALPVREDDVRRAFTAQLDAVARLTAADLPDEDAGWQAREDLVSRAAQDMAPVGWQHLLDAVDGAPERPDPSRAQMWAAAAGVIHAFGGGDEALAEDLVEMLGLAGELTDEQLDELRQAQRQADLEGIDAWGEVARALSVSNLRQVLARVSIEDLQRATAVIWMVSMLQGLVVMFGALQISAVEIELPERLRRFDEPMVRQLQADPLWPMASRYGLITKPRQRIRQLVLAALGLLIVPGLLKVWEAYRDRLLNLTAYE